MKRMISLLLMMAMLFAIVSCAVDSNNPAVTTEGQETTEATTASNKQDSQDKPKTYRILFIGNSYTHYNSMPSRLFAPIAKAAGYTVIVDSVMKGSYTLQSFADPNDAYGSKVHEALNSGVQYDYVVIQEQSSRPVSDPALFYEGVRSLDKLIKENGAKTVLYSTWGRETGHSLLNTMGWTNESMTWDLAAKYTAIGKELNAIVANAGLAFYDVYAGNKGVDIYNDDKTHPSLEGSYLAALTIFAAIFGETPVGISYRYTISEENAAILQQAAHDATFNPPEIPEQYRTSSEGVVSSKEERFAINDSQKANLTVYPTSSIISLGILGTKGQVASSASSLVGFTDAEKADIADIGYGISYIGVEKVNESKGSATALANLVDGLWTSSKVTNITFDENRYHIDGTGDNANGKYTALITLNFGSACEFDAVGFFSGSLEGFPGAAEVFISEDGVSWTRISTACWDAVNSGKLVSTGQSPSDANGSTTKVGCLFDMGQGRGQYVRIGIVTGRYDSSPNYNTINTREFVVYGKYLEK